MKFYLYREEPVQAIVAHPDTLAQLTAALPKADPRPLLGGIDFGLPLIPDNTVALAVIHLRPFKAPTA
ncbi:hypothetical protein [Streptomyces sp. NPDC051636]|uniref:hypothetical protein n=1 Tax=Streptomyces sp. NPDC051636 TaxID=3365663 RepID=UPI00378D5B67